MYLRTINKSIAKKVVSAGIIQQALNKLGTSDNYELYRPQYQNQYIVLFSFNNHYGHAGVQVLAKDEPEVFDFFAQCTDELDGWNDNWTNLTKAKFLLEWWQ